MSRQFRHGDRVMVLVDTRWECGEITVVKTDECKVMFDNSDLNYDYWPVDDIYFDDPDWCL